MAETITAFPLTWPAIFPRTPRRETSRFKTTLSASLANVSTSLRLFGSDSGRAVTDMVISSNVTLGVNRPADPGVAIWFKWDGEQRCIPVDRYSNVEDNLQAIHKVIEARRVELRHGTLSLVRATFEGFKALPPPPADERWPCAGPEGASVMSNIDRPKDWWMKRAESETGDASTGSSTVHCPHEKFGSRVDINRLSRKEGGPITGYSADVQIRCLRCGVAMRFIGLRPGVSKSEPTVSVDGTELRAPLEVAVVPEIFGHPAVKGRS